ncbi:MAG: hypothetical protein ACRD3B_10695 [Candidatus Sulfotelmatobacter sp.]
MDEGDVNRGHEIQGVIPKTRVFTSGPRDLAWSADKAGGLY